MNTTTAAAKCAPELACYDCRNNLPHRSPVTTDSTAVAEINRAIKPALDQYSAELEMHGVDFMSYSRALPTCKCGRTFTTAQGLGLHKSAADRAASRRCDKAMDEALGSKRA